jgi:hypothetical protein
MLMNLVSSAQPFAIRNFYASIAHQRFRSCASRGGWSAFAPAAAHPRSPVDPYGGRVGDGGRGEGRGRGYDRRVALVVPARPQGWIGDARAIPGFSDAAIAQDTIKAARSSRQRLFMGYLQAALRPAKACSRPTIFYLLVKSMGFLDYSKPLRRTCRSANLWCLM